MRRCARSASPSFVAIGSAEADDLTDLLAQYTRWSSEGFLEDPVVRPTPEPGLQGQVVGSYTLDSLPGTGRHGHRVARASQRRSLRSAASQ